MLIKTPLDLATKFEIATFQAQRMFEIEILITEFVEFEIVKPLQNWTKVVETFKIGNVNFFKKRNN